MKKILLLSLITMGLAGCATTTVENNGTPIMENNPQTLATDQINASMSDSDRIKLHQLVATASSHHQENWQSDKGGNRYEFTSVKIFVNNKGEPCREYKLTGILSEFLYHTEQNIDATACRMDDTHWRLVSTKPLT